VIIVAQIVLNLDLFQSGHVHACSSSVRSNKRAREKALTKWGKKLKWEKGEDSGAQDGKGEAGLGNKGELHLILLADKQTPTTASTHTHPHIHHFVFCTFAAKKLPTTTPHIHTSTVHTDTLLTTHTLPKPIKLSLSLSLL
jgi:hypothetical protein